MFITVVYFLTKPKASDQILTKIQNVEGRLIVILFIVVQLFIAIHVLVYFVKFENVIID